MTDVDAVFVAGAVVLVIGITTVALRRSLAFVGNGAAVGVLGAVATPWWVLAGGTALCVLGAGIQIAVFRKHGHEHIDDLRALRDDDGGPSP
jgi:NADH:ubiquinone oxidoreductase subunit K